MKVIKNFLFIGSCYLSTSLIGIEAVESVMEQKMDSSCKTEALMTFFPKQIVKNVLLEKGYNDEKAEKVAVELSKKDAEIVKLVDVKASSMSPNPFKNLNNKDQAFKIYKETLFEVFSDVLQSNGIHDEKKIKIILEEIREEKSKFFIDCIHRESLNKEEVKL